jgi:hypothetical protein
MTTSAAAASNLMNWAPLQFTAQETQAVTTQMNHSSIPEDIAVARLYLSKLSVLEAMRPQINTASLPATPDEVRALFAGISQFVESVKAKVATRSKDNELLGLASSVGSLRLKFFSLQRVFGEELPPPKPSEDAAKKGGRFESLLRGWIEHKLKPLHKEPLHEEDIAKLRVMYMDLPEGSADGQLMLQTIEENVAERQACANIPAIEDSDVLLGEDYTRDKLEAIDQQMGRQVEENARNLLQEMEAYPGFRQLLEEDRYIQDLFNKQVIRDELPLEVFVDHPFVAEFLRRSCSMEKSIAVEMRAYRDTSEEEDHGLKIAPAANHNNYSLPQIRVNGEWRAVRDLTGYGRGFLNNSMGFPQIGMHMSNPIPLAQAYENQSAGQVDPFYVYTQDNGLVPFNTRTWSSCNEETRQWQPVDMSEEQWWTALPVYKSERKQVENGQSGHTMEIVVAHSEEGVQFAGTHSYLVLGVPEEDGDGNIVRDRQGLTQIKYYSFGMFAYLFEGDGKAAKSMSKEVHYIDQDIGITDRAQTRRTYQIEKNQALRAFQVIKQERAESLWEGNVDPQHVGQWFADMAPQPRAPSFTLFQVNCGSFVQRVAQAIDLLGEGRILPMEADFNYSLSPFLKFIFMIIRCVPLFRWIFLWVKGGTGDTYNWNFVLNHNYTIRRYLHLKNETDELRRIQQVHQNRLQINVV